MVGNIDWSSDGKLLASTSVLSGLIIFDPEHPDEPVVSKAGYSMVSAAWRPGSRLVAASGGQIDLIDAESGSVHNTELMSSWSELLSWSPDGSRLARVSTTGDLTAMEVHTVDERLVLKRVNSFAGGSSNTPLEWSPDMRYIAGFGIDGLSVWDGASGEHVELLAGGKDELAGWVRWAPDGRRLAFSSDQQISIYDTQSWERLFILEGHESWVPHLAWSSCGRLLASIGWDATVRLWSTATWQPVAVLNVSTIEEIRGSNWLGLAFHPSEPVLATLSASASEIDLWKLDIERLLDADISHTAKYTTAKVVLVGDSGVGKTGLGYRLATGTYREHSSTHGQHFWVADELATSREDGTECEVVLWDLAGQSDYRLIHVLFLDDADTAIVVFDPTRGQHALDAVDFWLRALQIGRTRPCPIILVAARTDRGTGVIDAAEISDFVRSRNISGDLVATSASTGEGIDALVQKLKEQIPWDSMSATVTTKTFKAIKDNVLAAKDTSNQIMTAEELRGNLLGGEAAEEITDSELWAAVRNLEVHGYLGILRTASGERVILLAPELLNNLAASLILEARRNPAGLGAVDEGQALSGGYHLPEAEVLPSPYGQVLTEAAIVRLLEHNVCFRESLGGRDLLIFPELINEKPPVLASDEGYVDGVTYVIEGNVQNVYASLVVLLGYTNVLTRVNQWQNRAEYEIDGARVGFRQARVRDARLEITVYHQVVVTNSTLRLFQGLVERFLQRRNISVRLYPRVVCKCGFSLVTDQVVAFVDEGNGFTFCPRSGDRLTLPTEAESVSLTDEENAAVTSQSEVAAHRTALTVAVAQLRGYVESRDLGVSCFISYAWGDPDHERWVERTLVADLEAAGVEVVFDRESSRFGDDVARFIARMDECDYVLVVGTPSYLEAYENRDSDVGRIVAAEVDLYNQRLTGTEQRKRTIIPLLRAGDRSSALPPLLRGKACADLSSDTKYFSEFFDLALQLWKIDREDQAVSDIRKGLRELAGGPGRKGRGRSGAFPTGSRSVGAQGHGVA